MRTSGENYCDASGDVYGGWDRFGRTRDMRWTRSGSVVERSVYTYDRAGQRLTRGGSGGGSSQNEAFVYDGVRQLKSRTRGTTVRKEKFSYDPIGNWDSYDVWDNGTQTLDQTGLLAIRRVCDLLESRRHIFAMARAVIDAAARRAGETERHVLVKGPGAL